MGSLGESSPAVPNPPFGEDAAGHTVPIADGAGWHETAAGREPVESGPRHTRDREPAAAADARGQHRSVIRGAAHSLLVTPWFAAGAACVIAAALWLTAPHSSLTLIDPTIKTPCMKDACVSVVIDGTGTPETTTHGTTGHGHHGSGQSAQGSGAGKKLTTPGVTVSYHVLWKGDGKYSAQITIESDHALGPWKLSFRIPGTRINYVRGATWSPSGNGAGGTASALQGPGRYHHRHGGGGWNGSGASDRRVGVQPSAGQHGSHLAGLYGGRLGGQDRTGPGGRHAKGSGGQPGSGSPGQPQRHPHGGAAHAFSVEFVIYGTGSPVRPVGCTFDGTTFTFSYPR
jgi:hypothetical protein